MPRDTQTAAAAEPKPATKPKAAAQKPADATPETQNGTPEEQKPERHRPAQQQSRERVSEGDVPAMDRLVPEPIPEDERKKLNVFQKWSRMIEEVGVVPKRGFNAYHKYAYVLEGDMVAYVGPLLSKYALVVIPRVQVDHPRFERLPVGNQTLTRIPLEIQIINGDAPDEKITIPWIGEGADNSDKGAYKAYTGGMKTFYQKMLQIATGDDPELFERNDEIATQAASQAPQGGGRRPVQVKQGQGPQPAPGGKQDEANGAQLRSLSALSRAMFGTEDGDQRIRQTAAFIDEALTMDVYEQLGDLEGEALEHAFKEIVLKTIPGSKLGEVLVKMGEEAQKIAQERAAAKVAETEAAAAAEEAAETAEEGEQSSMEDALGGGYGG